MTKFSLNVGDCIEGMRSIPDKSINLVVTSPPYNLGIKYNTYKDDKNRKDYIQWCVEWGKELKRILSDDGSFFLNLGSSPTNPLLPYQIINEFSESKLFTLQNTIHWIKSVSIELDNGEILSKGHFKPINSNRYLNNCHEFIFHFTKNGKIPIDRLAIGVSYKDKSNIKRWSGKQDKRCKGNIWVVPYKTIQNKNTDRPHPASFPTKLVEQCILLHGNPQDTVMIDPFLGIGHSALAAKNCCIKEFIGYDIDKEYIKTAQEYIK